MPTMRSYRAKSFGKDNDEDHSNEQLGPLCIGPWQARDDGDVEHLGW